MATPTLEGLLKERVSALVGADLEAVEAEIRRELDSPVALIQEMGGYIAGAGGKRLRPILLLLAARLAGARGERPVRLACVVELLHTATLIHDDVVDQAPLRRGRPSANARWGDDASVLVGDHLYSKSFDLLVRDNDRAIMETLARATVSMTEAEVFQLDRKRSGAVTEADYVRIITQKTASFISACCRIGGLLGGIPAEPLEALTRYGLDIGIAFQISDDSLDLVADQNRLRDHRLDFVAARPRCLYHLSHLSLPGYHRRRVDYFWRGALRRAARPKASIRFGPLLPPLPEGCWRARSPVSLILISKSRRCLPAFS